ncbi:hypothetical protein HK104_009359 [Borealophlyctis nickersoniae]|nr:hypothetical protein HK104_009359 [Borealophlyctis nickersoniae]
MMLEMPILAEPDANEIGEIADMLEVVKKSGDMLIQIVNNILDFSKYEEEQFNLDHSPFLLRDALEISMEIVAMQDDKGQFPQLNAFVDPGLPQVIVGDPTRLRQIVVNLLANACKFTKADGDVTITACEDVRQPRREGKVCLLVTAADTGIGIKKADIGKLFEKFTQADASITRKYGGTGLGLAIVKRLCRLMDGEIWVEENTDAPSGTKFVFRIWVSTVEGVNLQSDAPIPASIPIPNVAYRELVLGVIEEHPMNIRGIQRLAEACGVSQVLNFPTLTAFLNTFPSPPFAMHGILIDYRTVSHHGETDLLRTLLAAVGDACLISCTPALLKQYRRERLADRLRSAARPVKMSVLLKFLDAIAAIPPVITPDVLGKLRGNTGVNKEPQMIAESAKDGFPKAVEKASKARGKTPELDEAPLPKLKILVCEDNKINQLVVGKILNKLGQTYTVADDGVDALELIRGGAVFDMIFMDIMMPRMDGLQATHEVREYLRGKDNFSPTYPWIVGLSANAFWDDRVQCSEAGMNDFVGKPAKLVDIRNAMIRYIEQSAASVT